MGVPKASIEPAKVPSPAAPLTVPPKITVAMLPEGMIVGSSTIWAGNSCVKGSSKDCDPSTARLIASPSGVCTRLPAIGNSAGVGPASKV